MRERGSNSIARRCVIGLDKRPGCWTLSWRRSGVMSSPPRRSTATTRRFGCWHRDLVGPRPGVCGSMCATTGRSAASHRRLPHTSTVPTAVASIRPLTWPRSPGSCRPMAMPGSRRCMVRGGLRPVRSPKSRVGRIAAAGSSTSGSIGSRRLPSRRSTASPQSMPSRPRPHSPLPPSGWQSAQRPHRCSTRSSHGPRRPWQSCRQSQRWLRPSVMQSTGAKPSPASSLTVGWKSTTTSLRTACESLRRPDHCAPPLQVSGNIGS